ncbi:MAG: hypothetical protein GX862_04165 [Leucobacter sp.]|nr:hypothetical protein [Leucobacter sp.]
MSDVSKTNEALIAEARDRAAHMKLLAKITENSPGAAVAVEEADRMTRFADALEAATRVPVQGEPSNRENCPGSGGHAGVGTYCMVCDLLAVEPNDDREALKRIAEEASVQRLKDSIEEWRKAIGSACGTFPDDWELEFWHAGYRHGANAMIEHQLSRATVSDAANELRAERDAAVAAIERVRAIHRPTMPGYGPKACVHDGRAWPCPTIAALDGAPEPEVEAEEEMYQAGCGSWDCRAPECGRA